MRNTLGVEQLTTLGRLRLGVQQAALRLPFDWKRLQQSGQRRLRSLPAIQVVSTMSGPSSVSCIIRLAEDTAMASRSDSSAMVTHAPVSSICFRRNARLGARATVPSVRLGCSRAARHVAATISG